MRVHTPHRHKHTQTFQVHIFAHDFPFTVNSSLMIYSKYTKIMYHLIKGEGGETGGREKLKPINCMFDRKKK